MKLTIIEIGKEFATLRRHGDTDADHFMDADYLPVTAKAGDSIGLEGFTAADAVDVIVPESVIETGCPPTLIPRAELDAIAEAIRAAVNEFGHPDEIPVTELETRGIAPATAEKCFALLTSEDFPADPTEATAKWMRLIGEFSE